MREDNKIKLSGLNKTWIFDIDGTIVKHNGYKTDGKDTLLEGVKEFFQTIPEEDMIILITSRREEYKEITEKFLKENKIRYDYIIYNAPYGERILVNDKKESGLRTALAINTKRNHFIAPEIEIDPDL